MGLYKQYTDDETGIPLAYHRISRLSQTTNQSAMIEVCSYISEGDRSKEKEYAALRAEGKETPNVYSTVHYWLAPYADGMTCAEAYDFLKGIPEFENAQDVLDDEPAAIRKK